MRPCFLSLGLSLCTVLVLVGSTVNSNVSHAASIDPSPLRDLHFLSQFDRQPCVTHLRGPHAAEIAWAGLSPPRDLLLPDWLVGVLLAHVHLHQGSGLLEIRLQLAGSRV